MKSELIALPVFQERVSPLMDVSDRYIIYETENGEIKQRVIITISTESGPQRIEKLKDIGVNTIICGAVSGHVAHKVGEKGMRLVSMIYGPIDEVIERYLNNTLTTFIPGPAGCTGRKKRRRGACAGGKGLKGTRQKQKEEEKP